ncbi:plasmid mobilization protein [uncultured Subdoligranulum sp.]|uniref:plasmid mobilization protein n=1 Tax=uncultured Subdoligranulum sp. TaxID=512298 RepID=UPI00320830DD
MLTRNVQMNIRVTPEEKKLFEQAATRCGLTLSQYIRMRLHNQMPRQLPNADYRQVLDALTALYHKGNTPEVQREILDTLLTVQRAVTVPQKEE